jgi:hypothetical protein
MNATGYYVLQILNSQVCCLLKSGGRVIPIAPESDCVKRFATLAEAWEACDEIKAEGMHPFFIRTN